MALGLLPRTPGRNPPMALIRGLRPQRAAGGQVMEQKSPRWRLAVFAVLVGMGFVMPALAQWRHEGAMTGSSVALCLLGALMTLAGGGAAIHCVTKRSA